MSEQLPQEIWESESAGKLPESHSDDTRRPLHRLSVLFTTVIASAWMLFHVYTTWRGNLPLLQHLAVVIAFAFALTFVWHPLVLSKESGRRPRWAFAVDIVLWVAALWSSLYLVLNYQDVQENPGAFSQVELAAAIVLVATMIEGCRRVLGWALPIFALVAIAFAYYGGELGPFSHPPYSTQRIFGVLGLSRQGVFTAPLAIVGTFLALYMLLAAAMQVSGTGDYFVQLAKSIFGRRRGGVGKVAVTSSALFGMISGAGVANAATTGAFTIPMMIRRGYSPRMSAALESTAAIGGQVMPPVMGAAAFMIASFLGISYGEVVKAALLPALLYYWAVYWIVDFESRRLGLVADSDDHQGLVRVLRTGGYHLAPVAVLLWALLVAELSPARSGLYALIAAILASWVRAGSRIGLRRAVGVMVAGARMTVPLVLAVGCVGVVIGVVSMSGLGLKLSGILIDAAGSSLFLLLVFTMIASLILGAGLPTTPTYLFLAILVAPALGDAGISLLAAHLFIFYYGVFSDMTPPLAVAPFVAAGIAGADPWKTTWTVMRIGMAAWLLPFMFAFSPGFLLEGGPYEIGVAVVRGTLGLFLLAGAVQGFIWRKLTLLEVVLAYVGAALFVVSLPFSDLGGAAAFVVIMARQVLWQRSSSREVPAPRPA